MKTEDEIFSACAAAEALAPKEFPPTLPPNPKLHGAPDWYSFEHGAWPIGEKIRQASVATPSLKKNKRIQLRIAKVIENRNLRRGRQPFVMSLAHVAAAEMKDKIAPFLSDPDIDGQVVDSLHKMKCFEFTREVSTLLESDKTWIKNKAMQYLKNAKERAQPCRPANARNARD
jgi:hypothetical protein